MADKTNPKASPHLGPVDVVLAPKVIVSESDPGQPPARVEAIIHPKLRFSINKLVPRADLIKFVQEHREIPAAYQQMLVATIEAIPDDDNILRLTAACHPHKGGFNFTFTVCAA